MMSENRLPVDDPRLTAYVLGELDPAGIAEVERLLEESPECREAVAEIRELAGLLSSGLNSEPAPVLSEPQRAAIVEAANDKKPFVATAVEAVGELADREAPAMGNQWARRFASVATIAAMLMVALLVVLSRKSNESAVDVSGYMAQSNTLPHEQRTLVSDKLRQEAKNAMFRAERIAEKDPGGALALISKAEDDVNGASIDTATQEQLTEALAQSRANVERFTSAGEPTLAGMLRKKEIEAMIRNEDAVKVQIQGKSESDRQGWIDLTERRAKYKQSAGKSPAQQVTSDSKSGEGLAAAMPPRLVELQEESSARRPATKRASGPALRVPASSSTVSGAYQAAGKPFDRYYRSEKKSDGSTESAQPLPALGVSSQKNSQDQAKLAALGYVGNVVVDEQELRERAAAGGEGVADHRHRFGLDVSGDGLSRQEQESLRDGRWGYRVDANSAGKAEVYEPIVENAFVTPLAEPLSTFSVDVDTASYANVRRFLTNRQMPPPNAVRIEELVNYFRYDDPQPVDGRPFSVNVEVGNAPWRPQHRLVRIGLKGREIPRDKRPTSNLVFLVDVSGSMSSENKLPLVKAGLSLLAGQMTEADRVAIVTYSDTATLRLESTTGDKQKPILDTIASLQAGGSTNGAGGIQLAYETAVRHFVEGGTNRVILCTDGDFNVGVSDDEQLVQLIQERARTKVFFSVFGFGMGNLKDGKLEKLADKGNGHYAYIDGQREAKKVFVDELAGTLVTIAKDVKLQVEFNPSRVGAYRLIGYENRALATQDFHNDKKDAGEIGAGHSVTALYEIAPVGNASPRPAGEGLKYQQFGIVRADNLDGELLTVKLRYKQPEADTSELFEVPAVDPSRSAGIAGTLKSTRNFEWAAAVAAFGMILRDSQYRGQAGLDLVLELAQGAKGEDQGELRQEFIDLVQTVKSMRPDLATFTSHVSPPAPPASAGEAAERSLIQAERRATVDGKYKNLLRVIPAAGDADQYGPFRDFGRWEGTSYLGHDNLPQGYWVYMAPNWYIWGDAVKSDDRK